MSEILLTLRLRNERMLSFARPVVMGIINVSPNSFYRPHLTLDVALLTAEAMIADGADILDIGGEATNPFVNLVSEAPSAQIEIDRILPVIEAIRARFNILISIDTSTPSVMRAAVLAGADMINDQRALRIGNARTVVAELKVPVCLMHLFLPERVPHSSDYVTLLSEIKRELHRFVIDCESAGIARDRIVIDPGFGQGHYGKSAEENYYLLNHISEFVHMGYPVLSGWSRKSMIGDTLSQKPADRLFGSVAAEALAAYHGAAIIRTHDVRATAEATKIAFQAKVAKNY